MTNTDKIAIKALVGALNYHGPERAPAIEAWECGLRAGELHKNPYMDFMSEVMAPVPDLVLRANYRKQVLHD